MKEIKHGTGTAYQHQKCRCEICKKWNSGYRYEQVKRDKDKYRPPTEETLLNRSIESEPHWKFIGHGFNPIK